MNSAFGIDHGEISKGKVPLFPKVVPYKDPVNGTIWRHRPPGKLLKEKLSFNTREEETGIPIKAITGGGLTRTGKVAAGTVGGGVAAGGTASVLQHRKKKS